MCSNKSNLDKKSNSITEVKHDEINTKSSEALSEINIDDIKIAPTYSKPKRAFLIFLICTLIGMWSLGGFINSSGRNLIVNKNGIVITANEFYNAYAGAIDTNKMKNSSHDEKMSIAQKILYELIQSKVLEKEIEASKLNIGDEDIAKIILANDAFRDSTGEFNRAIFSQYLKSIRLSERDFIKKIKMSMLSNQLIEAVTSQVMVSSDIMKIFSSSLSQMRSCQYLVINIENIQPAAISEDEIRLFFEQNVLMYPEGRSFKFIKISKNHKKYNEILEKIKNEFVDISEISSICGAQPSLVDFCSQDGMDKTETGTIQFIESIQNPKEFLNTLFSYGISEVFIFSTENAIFIVQNQDIFSSIKMHYDDAKKKIINILNHNKRIESGIEKAKSTIEMLKNGSIHSDLQWKSFTANSPYIHNYDNKIEKKLANMLFETKEPGYFLIDNQIVVFKLTKVSQGFLSENMVGAVKNYVNNTFINTVLDAYISVLMKRHGININQSDVNEKVINMIVTNY